MAAFVLPLRSLSLTCAAVGINTFVKCTTLLPLKYKCAQKIGCNIFSAHYLHSFIKKSTELYIYTFNMQRECTVVLKAQFQPCKASAVETPLCTYHGH